MEFDKSQWSSNTSTVSSAQYDMGLRSYMMRIYNYMAGALGLTGAVAFLVASSPQLMALFYGTPLKWVVMLAPLGVAIYLSVRVMHLSAQAAQAWFWAFAFLMGVSLATVFVIYTGASVARAFFITASVFGAMSLYGYTTKKDLTSIGSFLIMGVWGLIIASLVNMFMQSSGLHFAISLISVVVFTGLTAYDTQRLKEIYYTSGNNSNIAIMGALSLYLDFINLMVSLLRFVGERR